MRSTRRLTLTAVSLLFTVVTACSDKSGVQWDDYAPGVQQRIDAMGAAKDCTGLQSEFDAADANKAATKARTGHNNAELMGYIDDLMRKVGCYG